MPDRRRWLCRAQEMLQTFLQLGFGHIAAVEKFVGAADARQVVGSLAAQLAGQILRAACVTRSLFRKNNLCGGTLVAGRCSLVMSGVGKSNSVSMRSIRRRLIFP